MFQIRIEIFNECVPYVHSARPFSGVSNFEMHGCPAHDGVYARVDWRMRGETAYTMRDCYLPRDRRRERRDKVEPSLEGKKGSRKGRKGLALGDLGPKFDLGAWHPLDIS